MTYYYIKLKYIGRRQIVTENKELVCQFEMSLEGQLAYERFRDAVEDNGGRVKSWAMKTYKRAA